MTAPVTGTAALAAIAAAVEAEQLATFGYGTLGPRLSNASQATLAHGCEQAHRNLAENAMLLAAGAAPQSSAQPGGYQLPIIATDQPSAVRLAIALEEACASAWRSVLAQLTQLPASSDQSPAASTGANPSTPWSTAVAALTDSAVRAVKWRRSNDAQSVSVAFPGI